MFNLLAMVYPRLGAPRSPNGTTATDLEKFAETAGGASAGAA